MKKKILKITAWIILFIFLSVTSKTASLSAQTGTSEPSSSSRGEYNTKEEVIYAMLDPYGSVNQVYSVNILNVTAAGRVTDYGSYSSVKNLTLAGSIEVDKDAVSLEAQPGRFYYQGTLMDKRLPWIIDITFTLDGSPIEAADLIGRSGHLAIELSTHAEPGIDRTFYDNYLLQISVPLNTSTCSNIEAPGATIANAGTDKLINYTVMPGTEGNLTVRADVSDFEMKGISISAIPFTMNIELPDTAEYTNDLVLLADAITRLNDGMTSIKDGIHELKTGAEYLSTGSKEFDSGLAKISSRSEELMNASGQISGALSSVSYLLHEATAGSELSSLMNLPIYLTKLSGGLTEIAGGLTELNTGYSQAYTALDSAIRSIPEAEIPQTALQQLMINNPADTTLGQLIEYYTAARTVQATYQMVSPAFEAVSTKLSPIVSNITTIADALDTIATQLSSTFETTDLFNSIEQLTAGIDALAANYKSFDTGLKNYTGGIKQLADVYGNIGDGVLQLAKGSAALDSGIQKLKAGTDELRTQTASMPEQMEEAMNGILADFDTADFEPVSFLSNENTKITSVQFVFKTAAIVKPDTGQNNDDIARTETFWDRLLALFGGK